MTSQNRSAKASQAFEELKQQPAIGDRLTETSNFNDSYYFLKNYFDRYFTPLASQHPDRKYYLEYDLEDILKRKELKGDVSEYEFVKSRVDSALHLIEELLQENNEGFGI